MYRNLVHLICHFFDKGKIMAIDALVVLEYQLIFVALSYYYTHLIALYPGLPR